MKKLFVLMASAFVLLLVGSCDTKNIGNQVNPARGPQPTIVVPSDMFGNEDATWTVNYSNGTGGPFTIAWNFGGGANPNVANFAAGAGVLTSSGTVTMINDTAAPVSYTVTVNVTDALGNTGTATATYTVGVIRNAAPSIDSATFDAGTDTLTVTVSDPDDSASLDVNLTLPTGITADATTKTASQTGPLTATFSIGADDLFGGGSGDVGVEVTDGDATDTTSVAVSVDGITLVADTLIAVPLSSTGGTASADGNGNSNVTGDTTTIVVATGDPANPFQFMNGVGLTVDGGVQGADGYDITQGAVYVANSFNAGAVGGATDAGDGFWTAMPGVSFLLAPDGFIKPSDIGGGLIRIDFNLSPLAGTGADVDSSGELFNFEMAFGAAGTYNLGFQEFETVNRTFYEDGSNNQYTWGDISNAGVPNTVTIN